MSDISIVCAEEDIFSVTEEDFKEDQRIYDEMYPDYKLEEEDRYIDKGIAYSVLAILENLHNVKNNFFHK